VKIEDIKYPQTLLLDKEAETRWAEWHDNHIQEADPIVMPEGSVSAWSKLKGYCVRFALVMHEVRKACGEDVGEDVGVNSLAQAIALTDYFKSHTRKVHAHISGTGGYTEDGKAIIGWIQRGVRRTFRFSELWEDLGRRFDGDQGNARLELVRLSRVVRRIETPKAPNGKTPEVYQVNPDLFGVDAKRAA
jgi:hypothetical protein